MVSFLYENIKYIVVTKYKYIIIFYIIKNMRFDGQVGKKLIYIFKAIQMF